MRSTLFAPLTPILLGIALLIAATLLGILPIKKAIHVREAKHELKHGSAGFLRSISGWTIILFWAAATWFCATILGDWHMTNDLDGALMRAWLRLEILLEILAAFGED